MPRRRVLTELDEGDLLVHADHVGRRRPPKRPAGPSSIGRRHRAVQEVATVFGKVGRADTATDPAPFPRWSRRRYPGPHSEWPKLARRAGIRDGRPASSAEVLGAIAWSEETTPTTRRARREPRPATRLPGWTQLAGRRRSGPPRHDVRPGFEHRSASAWVPSNPARLDDLGAALSTPPRARARHSERASSNRGEASHVEFAVDAEPWLGTASTPASILDPAAFPSHRRSRRRGGPWRGTRAGGHRPRQIRAAPIDYPGGRRCAPAATRGDDHPPPPVALGCSGTQGRGRPATIR